MREVKYLFWGAMLQLLILVQNGDISPEVLVGPFKSQGLEYNALLSPKDGEYLDSWLSPQVDTIKMFTHEEDTVGFIFTGYVSIYSNTDRDSLIQGLDSVWHVSPKGYKMVPVNKFYLNLDSLNNESTK